MAAVGTGQLSLFGADVAAVGPRDLEGLLAGPGQVVRLGGTARVSVVVADEWRAEALLAEFAARGVSGAGVPASPEAGASAIMPDVAGSATALDVAGSAAVPQDPHDAAGVGKAAIEGHIGVRTAFSRCLTPIAARWIRGAVTRPPDDFRLDGPMLRLWYIAAGRAVGPPGRATQAVVLRLSSGPAGSLADARATWARVRAALARAGLPGALLGPRAGGPAYRIVGRRRVARFAELIGTRPDRVPPEAWPRVVSWSSTTGNASHEDKTSRTISPA